MRRRIEALADQLEEFVSEDGHDALVVTCDPVGAGLAGAAVDLLEQRGSTDVSILLCDPFTDVATFSERVRAQAAAAGDLALPPGGRAIDALLALARTVRAWGDVRVALWLLPTAIDDPSAYRATVCELARRSREVDPPLRVGARDADGSLAHALRAARVPTLSAALDASPGAIRDALAEEALDPSVDRDARLAALLTVAATDVASGRAEEALALLVWLANVFAERREPASQALATMVAANALWQLDRLTEARECIHRALAVAREAYVLPVLLSGSMLAGQLAMRMGDAHDADARFDVVARLGARLGAPHVVSQALFERGHALVARERAREACEAWTCAAEVARIARSPSQERAALEAIVAIQREAGLEDAAAPLTRRIASIDHDGIDAAHAGCGHAHAP